MIIINRAYLVAEIGVNHNGNIDIAKKLLVAARNAGADAVKTQSFYAEYLVSRSAKRAIYQQITTFDNVNQLEMLRKLELSKDTLTELFEYANELGITLFSTPFDMQSINDLVALGNPIFKISSGEINNLPYLIKIASLNKKTILSTGMSTLDEILQAVNILKQNGCRDLTVLHCNTQYPTPLIDANVRAMITLRDTLNIPVGYSDHTEGMEAALAAVALGATIIEKHFTLSRDTEGPDHKASMEPEHFAQMVKSIRNIETALGDGNKIVTSSEYENITIVRKSIIAKRDIKIGELFSEENITIKRPGNGISPMKWFDVLGKFAKRNFKEDELIEL